MLEGPLKMTSEERAVAHMKICGEIPATETERLQLIQQTAGVELKEAKELLQTLKTQGR